MILTLLIAFSMVLTGCGKKDAGSDLNIFFPEEQYREYIRRARGGATDLEALFQEVVSDPVKEKYGASMWYPPSSFDVNTLELMLNVFVNEDVVALVNEALHRCREYLQVEDVKVYVVPSAHLFHAGNHAVVRWPNEIFLLINPTKMFWTQMLPYTVAHEYHHVYYWTVHPPHEMGRDRRLLDALIIEGQADSFAQILYPDVSVPWHSISLSPQQLERFRENLETTDVGLVSELMWYLDGNIPSWYGNSVGFAIMQEFLNSSPHLSIEEWTAISPDDILENSGFQWNLD